MKLQRDVNPVEVSALSQIVMLTQRIGKSANEFLTAEGVNPEAVFLLEQGPELVQRDHQGRCSRATPRWACRARAIRRSRSA